ncbi:hypothetical protein LJR164_004666 [Phenylobacterium sp. LjRoot164]|jgi:hypothetical protein|uniref:hypothetical protein n=1 Tax=Pseudomonadota TaxID=1224 RepID=UPI0010EA2305|nr:MAG: hypothetical protein EON54_13890 [Alcaligenaceae bacterium]
MKEVLLVLIFWFASGLLSFGYSAEGYKYVSISSGSTIRLNTTDMKIVIDEHSVLAASGCVKKTGLQCIASDGGSFVFPAREIAEKMTWEFNGQKFSVSRKVRGQMLGVKYSGFIVQSRQGSEDYWYLISPEKGMLAFGAIAKSNTSTFVLEGRCGFAAAYDCK